MNEETEGERRRMKESGSERRGRGEGERGLTY
jgi:hypothetical protein